MLFAFIVYIDNTPKVDMCLQVTVVSEEFSPNITSDGAAGIWELYDYFNTDPARMQYGLHFYV